MELYRDRAGDWRFARFAANGERVAVGEGYARKIDARNTASKTFPGVPIVERAREPARFPPPESPTV